MDMNEEMYIKGFNAGYFISKYEPKLSLTIIKEKSQDNIFLSGMIDSINFYIQEMQLESLKNLRDKNIQSKTKDLES